MTQTYPEREIKMVAIENWLGAEGPERTRRVRLGVIVFFGLMLAIAGSLAAKKRAAVTSGTFPTHGPLFVTLLVLTVTVMGALTFFPVLALGPVAEETARLAGQSF